MSNNLLNITVLYPHNLLSDEEFTKILILFFRLRPSQEEESPSRWRNIRTLMSSSRTKTSPPVKSPAQRVTTKMRRSEPLLFTRESAKNGRAWDLAS